MIGESDIDEIKQRKISYVIYGFPNFRHYVLNIKNLSYTHRWNITTSKNNPRMIHFFFFRDT